MKSFWNTFLNTRHWKLEQFQLKYLSQVYSCHHLIFWEDYDRTLCQIFSGNFWGIFVSFNSVSKSSSELKFGGPVCRKLYSLEKPWTYIHRGSFLPNFLIWVRFKYVYSQIIYYFDWHRLLEKIIWIRCSQNCSRN